MGVPIFCILLGFLAGWVIIRIILLRSNDLNEILKISIKYGIVTTLITFLLMVIIWGGAIIVFFNHNYDFKTFGHPLILYDPKLSFYWMVSINDCYFPFIAITNDSFFILYVIDYY